LDVSKPGYTIDSVTFYHPKYLSKPQNPKTPQSFIFNFYQKETFY